MNPEGQTVHWGAAVQATCAAKRSIAPDAPLPSTQRSVFPATRVQVTNETSTWARHGASLSRDCAP